MCSLTMFFYVEFMYIIIAPQYKTEIMRCPTVRIPLVISLPFGDSILSTFGPLKYFTLSTSEQIQIKH